MYCFSGRRPLNARMRKQSLLLPHSFQGFIFPLLSIYIITNFFKKINSDTFYSKTGNFFWQNKTPAKDVSQERYEVFICCNSRYALTASGRGSSLSAAGS